MRIRNPLDWKQWLGINFNGKDFFYFFITTICVLILSYFLVSYVAGIRGYAFEPQIFTYKEYISESFPFSAILANYLYYIPETFNEEMLIGALFLFGLERSFKKTNNVIIAILVALLFSLMHQALYTFSPVQSGIGLTFITLSTLFFVGVLRNSLILKTRKITNSWAVHLSFNLIFFPGFYISPNAEFISEPEKFNLVFGNWPMFILTLIFALLSVFWLNFGAKKSQNLTIS
jgi:hypothetical protein